MSNLIPTARTDKNGVTSIRHMKPEAYPKKQTTALPPVSLQPSAQEISDHDFLCSIFADQPNYNPPETYVSAMGLIRNEHPGTVQTAFDLMALDNEHGFESMREYLIETMDGMSIDLAEGDTDTALKDFRMGIYADFDEMLVRVWSIGTVRAEYSTPLLDSLHDNDYVDGSEGLRIMLYPNMPPERNLSTDYWRGMTAAYPLNLDLEPRDTQKQAEVIEFVHWAGEQPDIASVIRLALERGTTDKNTLEGLLSQMKGIAPAITEGVL